MHTKWNNHKIGEIPWTNKHREHLHRHLFVQYVVDTCDSVLEIGPGEMVEYSHIKKIKRHPDTDP